MTGPILKKGDTGEPFSVAGFLRAVGYEMATRGLSVVADGVTLSPTEVQAVMLGIARDVEHPTREDR